MYWTIKYGYKHHFGIQETCVKAKTQIQATGVFHHFFPKEIGWHIVSMYEHNSGNPFFKPFH